ncbi:hypothetical protein [Candidatus Amarolinea dominans]|uniref:hypothetical protein n=1 Tax=Candidatus Amarolinea dominans TaxID=3140696 RepID=UPI003137614E|nr:hypothetical protein [Anaerolineae bacterium]
MSADATLARLRRLLLLLSGLLLAATVVELVFIGHTEGIQLLPFVLCAVGLIAVGLAWRRPERRVLLGLRIGMIPVALGSLLGVYEHIEGNIGLLLEVTPNATTGKIISEALGGANPLLAPGMLALAAVLAVAATYYHPALEHK